MSRKNHHFIAHTSWNVPLCLILLISKIVFATSDQKSIVPLIKNTTEYKIIKTLHKKNTLHRLSFKEEDQLDKNKIRLSKKIANFLFYKQTTKIPGLILSFLKDKSMNRDLKKHVLVNFSLGSTFSNTIGLSPKTIKKKIEITLSIQTALLKDSVNISKKSNRDLYYLYFHFLKSNKKSILAILKSHDLSKKLKKVTAPFKNAFNEFLINFYMRYKNNLQPGDQIRLRKLYQKHIFFPKDKFFSQENPTTWVHFMKKTLYPLLPKQGKEIIDWALKNHYLSRNSPQSEKAQTNCKKQCISKSKKIHPKLSKKERKIQCEESCRILYKKGAIAFSKKLIHAVLQGTLPKNLFPFHIQTTNKKFKENTYKASLIKELSEYIKKIRKKKKKLISSYYKNNKLKNYAPPKTIKAFQMLFSNIHEQLQNPFYKRHFKKNMLSSLNKVLLLKKIPKILQVFPELDKITRQLLTQEDASLRLEGIKLTHAFFQDPHEKKRTLIKYLNTLDQKQILNDIKLLCQGQCSKPTKKSIQNKNQDKTPSIFSVLEYLLPKSKKKSLKRKSEDVSLATTATSILNRTLWVLRKELKKRKNTCTAAATSFSPSKKDKPLCLCPSIGVYLYAFTKKIGSFFHPDVILHKPQIAKAVHDICKMDLKKKNQKGKSCFNPQKNFSFYQKEAICVINQKDFNPLHYLKKYFSKTGILKREYFHPKEKICDGSKFAISIPSSTQAGVVCLSQGMALKKFKKLHESVKNISKLLKKGEAKRQLAFSKYLELLRKTLYQQMVRSIKENATLIPTDLLAKFLREIDFTQKNCKNLKDQNSIAFLNAQLKKKNTGDPIPDGWIKKRNQEVQNHINNYLKKLLGLNKKNKIMENKFFHELRAYITARQIFKPASRNTLRNVPQRYYNKILGYNKKQFERFKKRAIQAEKAELKKHHPETWPLRRRWRTYQAVQKVRAFESKHALLTSVRTPDFLGSLYAFMVQNGVNTASSLDKPMINNKIKPKKHIRIGADLPWNGRSITLHLSSPSFKNLKKMFSKKIKSSFKSLLKELKKYSCMVSEVGKKIIGMPHKLLNGKFQANAFAGLVKASRDNTSLFKSLGGSYLLNQTKETYEIFSKGRSGPEKAQMERLRIKAVLSLIKNKNLRKLVLRNFPELYHMDCLLLTHIKKELKEEKWEKVGMFMRFVDTGALLGLFVVDPFIGTAASALATGGEILDHYDKIIALKEKAKLLEETYHAHGWTGLSNVSPNEVFEAYKKITDEQTALQYAVFWGITDIALGAKFASKGIKSLKTLLVRLPKEGSGFQKLRKAINALIVHFGRKGIKMTKNILKVLPKIGKALTSFGKKNIINFAQKIKIKKLITTYSEELLAHPEILKNIELKNFLKKIFTKGISSSKDLKKYHKILKMLKNKYPLIERELKKTTTFVNFLHSAKRDMDPNTLNKILPLLNKKNVHLLIQNPNVDKKVFLRELFFLEAEVSKTIPKNRFLILFRNGLHKNEKTLTQVLEKHGKSFDEVFSNEKFLNLFEAKNPKDFLSFHIETLHMKLINDHIDKKITDALSDGFKTIFLRKLKKRGLLKHIQHAYTDYKVLNLAIPKDKLNFFKKAYTDTIWEFNGYISKLRIEGRSLKEMLKSKGFNVKRLVGKFFTAGVGKNQRESALAARFARRLFKNPSSFRRPLMSIEEASKLAKKELESLRKSLRKIKKSSSFNALKTKNLIMQDNLPSEDFINILRKIKGKNPEERIKNLKKELQSLYGINLPKKEAKEFFNIYETTDRFSIHFFNKNPSRKVSYSFKNIEHTKQTTEITKQTTELVVSFDIKGAGATNLREMLSSLVDSKKTDLIERIKEGIQNADKKLDGIRAQFRKKMKVVFGNTIKYHISESGDDIVVLFPKGTHKLKNIKKLMPQVLSKNLRTTFLPVLKIGKTIPIKERGKIIGEMEGILKIIEKQSKKIPATTKENIRYLLNYNQKGSYTLQIVSDQPLNNKLQETLENQFKFIIPEKTKVEIQFQSISPKIQKKIPVPTKSQVDFYPQTSISLRFILNVSKWTQILSLSLKASDDFHHNNMKTIDHMHQSVLKTIAAYF